MDDLYKRIEHLCRLRGENLTQMCRSAHVPRSTLSDYKSGRIKSLSADKLARIAAHLEVSMDTLLGGPPPASQPEAPPQPNLLLDEFTYAMYGAGRTLTPEQKQTLLDLARFLQSQNKKKDDA